MKNANSYRSKIFLVLKILNCKFRKSLIKKDESCEKISLKLFGRVPLVIARLRNLK